MKTNEAPEKIYLNQDDGLIWHCRSYKDDIEYTRTDAFIENACEWLRINLSNYFDDTREDFELFIDDFRKRLKEE